MTDYDSMKIVRNKLFSNNKTFFGFIPEEVDFREACVLDVPEAVAFVPSVGKDVDRNLTADGERQALQFKNEIIKKKNS
jgi:hypothetical protein